MNRPVLLAAVLSLAVATIMDARPLNQKDLIRLDRLSDAHVSPDGKLAAYDSAVLDPAINRRNHSLGVVATDDASIPVRTEGANPSWGVGS